MLLSWVRLKPPQSSRKAAHIPIPYWPRRPPQPLSRSDLVRWHKTDMVGLADEVGFRGYSGSRIPGASGLSLTLLGLPELTHDYRRYPAPANAACRPYTPNGKVLVLQSH